MPKPTYDDLIFLIAFLWKWSDESDVLTALTHEEEYEGEAYESFSRLLRENLKRMNSIEPEKSSGKSTAGGGEN